MFLKDFGVPYLRLSRKNMARKTQWHQLFDEIPFKGIRLTSQRRAVISVVQESKSHLDAGSLLDLARKREPSIDRATVYRTIELLKKLRLIDELDLMHLEGEKHFYEVKTEGDHIHLACFGCGMIQQFTSPLFDHLKAEVMHNTGFEIRWRGWSSADSAGNVRHAPTERRTRRLHLP
jgi:Fe2+ or Zn2+ uptake regulation protein